MSAAAVGATAASAPAGTPAAAIAVAAPETSTVAAVTAPETSATGRRSRRSCLPLMHDGRRHLE
jgi:hypothetical protein